MNRTFLVNQAKAAAALGHVLEIEQYGRDGVKFRAVCTCGYASTQRRSQALALGAGFHHLGGVAAVKKRNGVGVSLPETVPPDL